MNNTGFSKCPCENCGSHIEFPLDASGAVVDCPHCSAKTMLIAFEEAHPAGTKVSASDVLGAFGSGISKPPVRSLYQLGLMLVSGIMLLLPILYVALVCLAGWGVYLYATHCTFFLKFGGGARLYILKLLLYVGPLFIGVILVLFMIKPLFARRPRHAQPLALNPAVEPAVFAFIARICDLVGAPMPKRIDLDCNLNASASFRRGAASFFGNDLVLTLGVPLVAGMNVQQLAGVIAHEFGHFTQGFGMRLSYIVRSINLWFARVAYERDAWDVWLEELVADAEDWRWIMLVSCAQGAVGFSRLILKLLMIFGHAVCAFLLRQMEYDADAYEVKLVGSDAFEATCRRIHVLGSLLKPTYNGIKMGFTSNRELPENLSAVLLKHDTALAHDKRTQLENTMGLEETSLFDTHPSNGDRIRAARRMEEPGIFHLQTAAAALFNNFEVLAKQVTQLHYTEDLGIPVAAAKLVPVHDSQPPDETPAFNPLAQKVEERLPGATGRLRIKR